MALFKSKKSALDKMKVKDIEAQIGELEKKKILLGAEMKKDQAMISRLKEEGMDKDDQERRSIAYKILRIDNGLKQKVKRLESMEKEILGLDNVKNLVSMRNQDNARNKSIMEADIDSIKQGAMEDKIRSEEYEKKLQQLSELTTGNDNEPDDKLIREYADSIWGNVKSSADKREENLDKKIDEMIKEKSEKENDNVGNS
ncbi:MAG: hypothetical protein M1393_08465 [Candidatus Thermoplasmatota archaeon]|nr:hypothetical protein [Candidatus Thermoplasmatota archaeon]MDA8143689.1 hypothetical protein [Thermoplasmatales archaeon]